MAQKFVPLDDAAKQLGISKERLNELREAGKVRAYRDGASWKFRSEDLSALSQELTGGKDPSVSDLALEALDEPSDPADSILVSDAEVGGPANRPPSTVIGQKKGKAAGESDLELTLESESSARGGASDVLASTSGSHILGPSETPPISSGKFDDLDEIEIDLDTESSKIQSGLDLPKVGGRRSKADQESDLRIVESGVHDRRSDQSKDAGRGSDIRLAEDEDDDMVLSESGGSDITLSAGDSGINLVSPSDSGLALDDLDLDLAGSGVSSLEVDESADRLQLEEAPAPKSKASRKDDDFLLTPLGESSEGDSSSQVIELDSAEELQESAAMFERPEETAILEPVEDEEQVVLREPSGLAASLVPADEVQFSGANVGFLILCLLILAVTGVMMLDMLRHIWSWDKPYQINAWLIDSLNFFV